jgi:gamma-carbonic anhydrase
LIRETRQNTKGIGRPGREPHWGFLVSSGSRCYLEIFTRGWRIRRAAISRPCHHLRGICEALNHTPDIRAYRGKFPQIAASAYIDPAAVIIGDVVIGENSSVWPGTVVRGDVHYIRIGARTNLQDRCVLHVMKDEYPLILGDDVTVGHSVTLHGCTVESRVLIGMGSIILNGAVIGGSSIIAAGSLITERIVIPPGSLVMGAPGKVKRALTGIDQHSIDEYAKRYAGYSEIYRAEAKERGERIDWSGSGE